MSNNPLAELKERIFEKELVEKLLEELGCNNVAPPKRQPSGDYLVTAQAPDSKNKRGIQVYLTPTLHCEIVNEGISGDIYSVVAFILYGSSTFDEVRSNLYQIKTHICNLLEFNDLINQRYTPEIPKVDWNYWLRPIQEQRGRVFEITENEVIDEIVLNEFVNDPWGKWYFEEGIPLETQRYFGIGFHVLSESITIPIHNKHGQLIGVKGRYVGSNKEIIENKKYSYIYSCSKNIELFNLHRATSHIQDKKQVIIVEGAKTTMKLWGWEIRNAVSIEGDKLSPFQVKLLKDLGLDIDLIFAWDKGKDKEFVEKQIKQIKNRRIYYLLDNPDGILSLDRFENKQSPADKTKRVFEDLLENDIYEFKH